MGAREALRVSLEAHNRASGGILVLEISVSRNIKHSSPYARFYLKMQYFLCVLAYLQKRRESRESEKETPAALGALFGEAEKKPRCLKSRPKVGQETSKWRWKASGRGNGRIAISTTPLS